MAPDRKTVISTMAREVFEWDKWVKEIPYINFPLCYEVKIIPPTNGAIVRYLVRHKENRDLVVSVYLDCYAQLGCCYEPYWEIYPDDQGECFRCGMNETKELLKVIKSSFKRNKGE